MKAWLFYTPEDWRLEDIPIPSLGKKDVLVKIAVVQPGVTHAGVLLGGPHPHPGVDIRKVLREKGPLQLFGNEFSGVVVEVGGEVTRFKPGQRIACIKPSIPCGKCTLCRSGQVDLCKAGPAVGYDFPGCFAEYGVVPEMTLISIPDTVTFQAGACVQSLHTPLASVAAAELDIGDTVAVLGTGNIGFGVLQIARMSGAGEIYVTARRRRILDLALGLGADEGINVSEVDPVKAVLELTNGAGVDVVFECAAGNPALGLAGHETIDQALEMVRFGGKIIQSGTFAGPLGYDVRRIKKKGLRYISSIGLSQKQRHHLIYLLAKGFVKMEPMITHAVHGLDRLPEAVKITADKRAYDAILPCQIIVD